MMKKHMAFWGYTIFRQTKGSFFIPKGGLVPSFQACRDLVHPTWPWSNMNSSSPTSGALISSMCHRKIMFFLSLSIQLPQATQTVLVLFSFTLQVEPVDVATARLAPEEGEEEELLEDDAVVEPSEDRPADAATASMPLTLTSSLPLTLASLSETAELLLKQGGGGWGDGMGMGSCETWKMLKVERFRVFDHCNWMLWNMIWLTFDKSGLFLIHQGLPNSPTGECKGIKLDGRFLTWRFFAAWQQIVQNSTMPSSSSCLPELYLAFIAFLLYKRCYPSWGFHATQRKYIPWCQIVSVHSSWSQMQFGTIIICKHPQIYYLDAGLIKNHLNS